MIYLGIDDTDTLTTPGTNQLAREIVSRLAGRFRCVSIVRHQLFFDPRVPYTSKNGSASIRLEPLTPVNLPELISEVRHIMQEWFVEGSDPGLVAAEYADPQLIPADVISYAQRCKCELIDQREPRELAARHGIFLAGLGGTEGGVIGALAALGLIASENDGRVIQWQSWPDDLTGPLPVTAIQSRRVTVRRFDSRLTVDSGTVDVGKKLRPNLFERQCVLWVAEQPQAETNTWQALKVV